MAVPIRSLQQDMWVLLEDVGLVQITGLTWFSESVDIEFDGTNSPLAHRPDRAVKGIWSGRFDDYPVIDTYVFEGDTRDEHGTDV